MPIINLTTIINAPVAKVFDLARSIDLHQQSMAHTYEKAIEGTISGLINEGETVTWEAKHFFRTRRLRSKITSMKPYSYFRDEMLEGDFKLLEHDHYFTTIDGGTEMKDAFYFKAPYGWLGRIAELLFLTRYLRNLLMARNAIVKKEAEDTMKTERTSE
jgi:ligand-binding SRPBCC domain-containing protein